jgi:hypothetical protein
MLPSKKKTPNLNHLLNVLGVCEPLFFQGRSHDEITVTVDETTLC